jgi:hypothetical protein
MKEQNIVEIEPRGHEPAIEDPSGHLQAIIHKYIGTQEAFVIPSLRQQLLAAGRSHK